MREANPRQSPWLSGRFGRRVFGFGPDDDTDPGYAVGAGADRISRRTPARWPASRWTPKSACTRLTRPPSRHSAAREDLAARKGTIRVVLAERASSEAVAVTPFVLPEAPRGRLVRSGRDARLRVALIPVDAGLAAQLAASPLIERVEPEQAELTLARRADGGWALGDDVHGTGETADEPVLAVIPADRLDTARAAVEHYHAYSAPLRMARACRDLPSLLRLWLLDCGDAALAAEAAQDPDLPQVQPGAHAPYEIAVGDRVCFVVENAAEVALSVALFDCAASGRVVLLGEKRVPRLAKHVFWFEDTLGNPFTAGLPDDRRVGVDRIDSHRHHPARRLAAVSRAPPDFRRDPRAAGQGRAPRLRDLGGMEEPSAESWTSALTAVRIDRRD